MAAPNFYLREDSGPSLDGVAAQLGISPSYLSRIFSEIDGKRFTQYLSDLRIEKAKQLPKKTACKEQRSVPPALQSALANRRKL